MIIFIPLGIYLSILIPKRSTILKLILIGGLSLLLEILQYAFAIGATDITDLIMNTLGGAVGLAVYGIFLKAAKDRLKVQKVINILAGICTFLLISFIVLIMINSY